MVLSLNNVQIVTIWSIVQLATSTGTHRGTETGYTLGGACILNDLPHSIGKTGFTHKLLLMAVEWSVTGIRPKRDAISPVDPRVICVSTGRYRQSYQFSNKIWLAHNAWTVMYTVERQTRLLYKRSMLIARSFFFLRTIDIKLTGTVTNSKTVRISKVQRLKTTKTEDVKQWTTVEIVSKTSPPVLRLFLMFYRRQRLGTTTLFCIIYISTDLL